MMNTPENNASPFLPNAQQTPKLCDLFHAAARPALTFP